MVQLGTFILAFGWFGFNAGSSLAGTDGRIGIVAVNTMIAGMSATLSRHPLHVDRRRQARPVDDVQQHARRPRRDHRAVRLRHAGQRVHHRRDRRRARHLAACSSSTRSRSTTRSARSACTASTARGACSRVGLFSDGTYGAGWNGVGATEYLGVAGKGVTGLFYGDGKQLIAQFDRGAASASRWNVVVGGVIFWVLGKVLGSNRVSAEVEIAGLDIPEMGVPGYPEFVLDHVRRRMMPGRPGRPPPSRQSPQLASLGASAARLSARRASPIVVLPSPSLRSCCICWYRGAAAAPRRLLGRQPQQARCRAGRRAAGGDLPARCTPAAPGCSPRAAREYAAFIALLGALFVITSAGSTCAATWPPRPRVNTAFLAAGALLASVIGTTGAWRC